MHVFVIPKIPNLVILFESVVVISLMSFKLWSLNRELSCELGKERFSDDERGPLGAPLVGDCFTRTCVRVDLRVSL